MKGEGRWRFELHPINMLEPNTKNLNYVRIAGKAGDADDNDMNHIYRFPIDTKTVEFVFVDKLSESRIVDGERVTGSPTHRVFINVLKQKDTIGVAFERKINHVMHFAL